MYSLQPRALQVSIKSQVFNLHPDVYAESNHARWLVCGLASAVSLGFDRIVTADNYQRLVCTVGVVSIIIDTFPFLYLGALSGNEETGMATPSTSSWSQDPMRTSRACYWHATIIDVYSTPDSNPHTAKGMQENSCACPLVSLSDRYSWPSCF